MLSAASSLKVRKNAWRINLLGILNVASFVELVQKGHVSFDHLTGSLTAADQISARRIRVASAPLESDPEKLREVLFESLMVTTAYQASRALGSTLSLTAEQSYLEQRSPTREADLAEHFRTLVALGLCSEDERDTRLREAQSVDIGRSTFFVHNRFDPKACDALFLDSGGAAWPVERYETIARRAFVALFSSTDPNQEFRRRAIEADTVWSQMRRLGDDLRRALPSSVTQDARKLALVTGDVLTIVWWAKAMSRAATGTGDDARVHRRANGAGAERRSVVQEAKGGARRCSEGHGRGNRRPVRPALGRPGDGRRRFAPGHAGRRNRVGAADRAVCRDGYD